MKVTAVETIRVDEFPNLLWVQVETDAGLVGLGETYFGPQTVEAQIHEFIAPLLRGVWTEDAAPKCCAHCIHTHVKATGHPARVHTKCRVIVRYPFSVS